MDERLRNKLNQYEVTPPPGNWEAILTRLEDEPGSADIKLSERLFNFEVVPPSIVWDNIAGQLQEEVDAAPVVPMFPWKRVAVAASIIGIAGLALFLYFSNSNKVVPAGPAIVSTTTPVIVPKNNDLQNNDQQNNDLPRAEVKQDPEPQQTLIADNNISRPKRQPLQSRISKTVSEPSGPVEESSSVPETQYLQLTPSEPIESSDLSQPIAVSAPPIKDASGKLIIDNTLLFADGPRYITVTSPNGEQTRISSKFFELLDKLYNTSSSGSANAEWKNRFEEWRNKFLEENGFVPAAGNYMDILELKEMLLEQ